ncbi:MAG: serine/threonine protein kinase [Candidatus Competibacteraceae bacterium]|nr:MAG: serine/threonine protein kinase [Candidatus Competibacteraceae bacterium]
MSPSPEAPPAPAATVRDDLAATRLDGPAPTVRDAAEPPRTLMRLPSALAGRYRLARPMPTAGGEADLLLVDALADGQRYVAKIYRYGIQVKREVLDRIQQAGSDAVAHLIEHGQSDGHCYEVLEYLPKGSLRSRLEGGPLADDQARALVAQASAALAVLHARDILHRDLKPENVLIRQWQPLRIALTDFGIASVAEATQHFTSAARTLRYAAPEAATGVIGAAADYWSLGMLVLEAVSGRHPYAGLSDAVLSYQLVTQPVDCGAVADPWRTLCRGLLARDPKQRWGQAEIERWLAGDEALRLPVEAPPPETATRHYRPYRFQGVECWTARELALHMARHWEAGVQDLRQGFLLPWLRDEWRDQDLARAVLELSGAKKKLNHDERLLRVLVKIAPDLPPVWKQASLASADLLAAASAAMSGNSHIQKELTEIYQHDVLGVYGDAGNAECQEVREKWQRAVKEYEQAWTKLAKQGVSKKLRPDRAAVLPVLLLVSGSPSFGSQLKDKINKTVKKLKSLPDYLRDWLDKPIDGMSLALCTVVEAQLRLEPMLSKFEVFRKEYSILGENREIKADLSQMEDDIYAGVYGDLAEFQKALDTLENKIEPLSKATEKYQGLLTNLNDRLFRVLRYKTSDAAVEELNEIIEHLEHAVETIVASNLVEAEMRPGVFAETWSLEMAMKAIEKELDSLKMKKLKRPR